MLAAAVRQDGPMAITVTEGEPKESRMLSATLMSWQGKLATFAETKSAGACGSIHEYHAQMRPWTISDLIIERVEAL